MTAMAIEKDGEGRHCPVCGNFFYSGTEFCSDACFGQFKSRKKICKECGKEFYPKYAGSAYCSDICRAKKSRAYCARQKERRENTRREFLRLLCAVLEKKNRAKKVQKKICLECGREFETAVKKKKFCSPQCSRKWFNARRCRSKKGRPEQGRKEDRIFFLMKKYRKECLVCGIGFYSTGESSYCSQQCENTDWNYGKMQIL